MLAMSCGLGWPASNETSAAPLRSKLWDIPGVVLSNYTHGVGRYPRKDRASSAAQQQRASRKAKNVKRHRTAGRG